MQEHHDGDFTESTIALDDVGLVVQAVEDKFVNAMLKDNALHTIVHTEHEWQLILLFLVFEHIDRIVPVLIQLQGVQVGICIFEISRFSEHWHQVVLADRTGEAAVGGERIGILVVIMTVNIISNRKCMVRLSVLDKHIVIEGIAIFNVVLFLVLDRKVEAKTVLVVKLLLVVEVNLPLQFRDKRSDKLSHIFKINFFFVSKE